MTIKRIEPVSCAKIVAVVYAAIGFLIGALFSLVAVAGTAFANAQHGLPQNALSPLLGAFIGIGAIVAFPIMYGVIGFVFALLAAFLYNLAASRVGGIEIDVA